MSTPLLVVSAEGNAQPADEWRGEYDVPPNELRSDFTIGAKGGLWTGEVVGSLNEADAIDDPARQRSTGFGGGGGAQAWVGLPIRDYLTFALGATGGVLRGSGREALGAAFLLRLEGYPMIALGGEWARLGLSTAFGVGSMATEQNGETVAEGGALSVLGLGAFWEGFGAGGFQVGPALAYTHMFSQTMQVHLVSLSVRVAFYAGP